MENLVVGSTELRIQSMEDGLSDVANGSSVPSSSSSSSSLMLRKIEFHPARKSFTGFGNSSGDFRIETLNSDSASRKRPLGFNPCQSGKKVDGSDLPENGLDSELSFGITFRRIGAGLENLGNTCFLNSVLQCLTYTEPLAAYLQSGKHQNSCHIAGFCALCAIQKHVSRALQSTGRSLVPKDLVSNLRCISRNFRNCRQEDAHEYMVNLLESMHKCCLPLGVPSESPAAYEKSLVHKIFGGRLRSQVECQQCSYCSNKFDPFLDLSLEIVKADSLPVALRNFTAAELLDGGEKQYQCQRCKQKVRAKKRLTVHNAPYVLTIHLKRFHAHDPGRKVDKKVLFDRSLDMKPFVSDSHEGDLKYSLYGVLVHFGHNTHSGHYVCFVRTSSGIWYLLNDNEVRQVSEKRVLDQKAYMLFYVRDRKSVALRKPIDVVQKEKTKATVGSNITNLVFKQLSKEHDDNGSVDDRSLATSSIIVVNRKDPLNVGTSKEIVQNKKCPLNVGISKQVPQNQNGALNVCILKDILQKESSNQPVIAECGATQANASGEPSSSALLKDLSKEVSTSPKANPGPEPSSSSITARVDNATVRIGSKLNDCNEAFSKCIVPQNTCIEKLDINEASEKVTPNLNGRVDETVERVPSLSPSVDSACVRTSNKIDSVKSPNIPSGESSQGEGFSTESAAQKSLGEQAGGRGQQIGNELVDFPPLSIQQNGCVQKKNPDCEPLKKVKKKLSKCRIPNFNLGKRFIRASIGSRKKKKYKKSKHRMLHIQNLIKEQLLENNSLSSQVGPSTSQTSISVPMGATNARKKKGKYGLKDRGDSLIEVADVGLETSNNQKMHAVAINKQLKKTSFSLSDNLRNTADFAETSKKCVSENGMMYMLTRGLEETTVPRWDGVELLPSQMVESSPMENFHIGYVPDEWDEEYDQGKRKKLRRNKHEFGGPNPFQEFASQKKQFKKAKMDRSSSGDKPFRI